ncbi:hypothetical protein M404DRAFT_992712 [Pisolithus tinctorius Marx 270]|uniref:Uncharacterized protein n=1 Tax=Pisolithus tinctorius Marx 270 TaxID=870435 RepID=A0A0C3PW65_PISTI|nr:hypothetical protein M404DRAFT_992712 [Pisolithus tinctorius Marx 270]
MLLTRSAGEHGRKSIKTDSLRDAARRKKRIVCALRPRDYDLVKDSVQEVSVSTEYTDGDNQSTNTPIGQKRYRSLPSATYSNQLRNTIMLRAW